MAIDANVGSRVGDYILAKKLGEGGMAEVWLARHCTAGQLRAVKFLNRQFQGYPEVEARFQTEGDCQLVHPNIVRIYQVGQDGGSSYIVMDFVEGRDLEKILDSRRGPLTVPESVDIGMQILSGLGFAHSSGIIHRDIKPSNVLVDSEGQARLMDFGIAKAMRATRSMTQVNSRLGTPDYMSPEQIRNPRDVDSRSDIYSFGCLFYELLTGWPPFDRNAGYETEHDIKTAHVAHPPTPPRERRTNIPVELNDVTLRCLAKAKEDRPQSCEEIIAALVAYRDAVLGSPESTRSIRRPADVGKLAKPSGGGLSQPDVQQRRETEVIPSGHPTPPPGPFPPGFSGPAGSSAVGSGPVGSGAVGSGPAASSPSGKSPSGPGFAGSGIPAPSQYPPPVPSQPGTSPQSFGYGQASRTPTVTDEALYRQPPAVPQQANAPNHLPPVPNYAPPVPSYVPIATQTATGTGATGKGKSKLLMVAGSVLLLAALGGGGWAIYRHMNPDTVHPGPTPEPAPPPGPVNPIVNPSGNNPPSNPTKKDQPVTPTPADKRILVVGGPRQSAHLPPAPGEADWKYVSIQPGDNPACARFVEAAPVIYVDRAETLSPVAKQYPGLRSKVEGSGVQSREMTPAVRAACGAQYQVVAILPPKVIEPPQPQLASGSLIWTGNPSTFGKFVTIVRSSNQALQGGQLTGTMFPAGPVQLSVRSPSAAMVQQPQPSTHYNSFNLFFAESGQQTVVIDWKQLPNPN